MNIFGFYFIFYYFFFFFLIVLFYLKINLSLFYHVYHLQLFVLQKIKKKIKNN